MSLAITGRQRDLLYDIVLDRLTGIDQVWRSVQQGEWESAQRLGREYSDLLRLVVDGLGWRRDRDEAVELTGPPDAIQGALEAIRREAAFESRDQLELRLRAAQAQIDRQDTLDTCDELLARLTRAADKR